jgi:hypothetical protein
VAEELAMLDYLTGGRLVVGFLRGTVNEDQTFSVNPTETRGRSLGPTLTPARYMRVGTIDKIMAYMIFMGKACM